MGGALKNILQKHAWTIIGFAALWPCFHTSPYYPFVLSPGFSVVGADILSWRHLVYAVALGLLFIAALPASRYNYTAPQKTVFTISAGIIATLASVCMASGLIADKNLVALENIAMVCIAFGVVACFVSLFLRATVKKSHHLAFVLVSSYVVYSFVWLACELLFAQAVPYLLCICPGLAAVCASRMPPYEGEIIARDNDGKDRGALPWSMLAASILFVYFGVVCVRIFTTMQQGTVSAGQLVGLPYIITAAAGLALACFLAFYFYHRDYTNSRVLAAFAALSLLYLGAFLLIIVLQSGNAALVGKRIMVAVEHCFELLILVTLACSIRPAYKTVLQAAVAFGIVVLILPQVLSLDILLQTGLLASFAQTDLVMPIAAIATFIIAALLVGMLLKGMRQTVAAAQLSNEEWQRELCRRAFEGIDITPRELDVALFTYKGLSAKKVAEELYVSESTVKVHLQHVYRKLDVHTKQELIERINSFRDS